ncbi:MAG TPA: glycoside hydrolase family 32 protein [Terracidiphilus sp.]|nr:glycoside hydrolase family 32 protein [Terracidiphilus sp.]
MNGTRSLKLNRRAFVVGMNALAASLLSCSEAFAVAADVRTSANNLAADPRRPQFHLLPPANWMNDPNGPIYWNGNYHMFYQYNPDGAYWGNMHWGHAMSEDMVHWKHLPVALSPTPGGPDSAGCFTGTAVVQNGRVELMYTGVRAIPLEQATIKDGNPPLRESQCLAVANDPELKTWTKVPTPVISNPPSQLEVNGFRDPSPWRQGDWWYTVLGSGVANRGGAVLLYKSKDLRSWEFMHLLAQRDREGAAAFDPTDPWDMWECPDFFALGDWKVLICSTLGRSYWRTGKLDPDTMMFHSEQSGILDYGSYYAPKTHLDHRGNRILWGWVQEARPVEEYKAAGWAGVMSLPRVLSVEEDGRLQMRFAPELHSLRRVERQAKITESETENQRQIASIRFENGSGEILCTAQRSAGPFQLIVSALSDHGVPLLILDFDPSRATPVSVEAHPISVRLGEHEDIEMHLYVDASVIEVLVNGQAAWTKRFYLKGNTAPEIGLQWKGSTRSIQKLMAWQIAPISDDRLTT